MLIGVNGHQGIYFWDHEFEADSPDMPNVYKVSETFTEFLGNLHEIEL